MHRGNGPASCALCLCIRGANKSLRHGGGAVDTAIVWLWRCVGGRVKPLSAVFITSQCISPIKRLLCGGREGGREGSSQRQGKASQREACGFSFSSLLLLLLLLLLLHLPSLPSTTPRGSVSLREGVRRVLALKLK